MAMNCDRFLQNIDAYIDGELSQAERDGMDRHARECASCAQRLEQANRLATLCQGLNDDLEVPLDAQAAWRRAVRAEAARNGRKRRALNGWMRGFAATAAALVVLITGAYTLRDQPTFNSAQRDGGVGYDSTGEYEGNEETAAYKAPMPMVAAAGYSLSADGDETGMTRTAVSGAAGAAEDAGVRDTASMPAERVLVRSARREIASDHYEADCMWLDNLVSEYDAYFAERGERSLPGSAARKLNARICVPSDRLDEFLVEMNQLGEITLKNDYTQDVTAPYLDAQAQVTALSEQQVRLEECLATAQAVDDVLAIDERLTDIRMQLQRLNGEMSGWVSYSTVTLTMTERLEEAEPEKSMSERMRSGFDDSVLWLTMTERLEEAEPEKSMSERMRSGFDDSVLWLRNALVALVAFLPRLVIWIPALILVIILLRVTFRGRK